MNTTQKALKRLESQYRLLLLLKELGVTSAYVPSYKSFVQYMAALSIKIQSGAI
jgi:hypothetical protein